MPTAGTASGAAGVVSLVLLTASVILGIAVSGRRRLPGLPRYATRQLHRNTSLLAGGFLAVHIVTAVAIPFAGIRLTAAIIPFAPGRERLWVGLGTLSADLVAALLMTSLLRRHIGRRSWRAVHWLAYICWPAALAHGLGTGSGMHAGRLLGVAVGCVIAVTIAAGWRLAPALSRRRVPRPPAGPERVALTAVGARAPSPSPPKSSSPRLLLAARRRRSPGR